MYNVLQDYRYSKYYNMLESTVLVQVVGTIEAYYSR